MKLKILIFLIFSFAVKIKSQEISCNYVLENTNYACNLQINNPNGFDGFVSIPGNHLDGFDNTNVTIVRSSNQVTANIPSVICRQFTNLNNLIIVLSQVREIHQHTFAECGNLETLTAYYNLITEIADNSFINNGNLRAIDLTDNRITQLSLDTFRGSVCETLTLDYNELTEFNPTWFESISATLRVFNLHSNLLRELPNEAFSIFTNLESLHLSANYLEDIPVDTFNGLQNLRIFSLYGNLLSNLRNEWFASSPALESIRLEFNRISELPIGVFSNNNLLDDLGLTFNTLSVIDSRSFGNLTNLRTLYAEFNYINAIDSEFFDRAVNLNGLFLFNNVCSQTSFFDVILNRAEVRSALSTCFANFQVTSTLECFYISAEFFPYTCELTIVNPSGRDDFESIDGEHVEGNGDADVVRIDAYAQNTLNIPSILCDRFVNLREMVIQRSQIEMLSPLAFANCAQLTFVDLEHNDLSVLPEAIFSNNHNLEILVLNDNRIGSLGINTFENTQIWYLDMQRNALDFFNAAWFNPINNTLKSLNIVANSMSYLPPMAFANLRNLEELEIGMNPFMSIPNDAFVGLTHLEYLAMYQNNIHDLQSSWFNDLTSLLGLHIQQNSIQELPEGIFSQLTLLDDINLSQNNLSTLNSNAFGSVGSLFSINAQLNRINAFDPDLFDNAELLYILFLYGNQCVSANFINVAGSREAVRNQLDGCIENFILQEGGFIGCDYVNAEGFGYFCEMSVNNPRGVDDFEVIEGIHIEDFTDSDVFRVEAYRQSTTIVPSIICRQFTNLRELYIGASEVADVSPVNFENCANLEYLNLELNSLRHIPANLFTNSPNLGFLSLVFNELSSIDFDAFTNTAIWNLNVNGNRIIGNTDWLFPINETLTHFSFAMGPRLLVPDGAFANIRNILELDLSDNELEIGATAFDGASGLQFLWLVRCNLREINARWFANLQNFQGLFINYNQLTSLPSGVFANNPQLFELNIGGNDIRILNSDSFGNLDSLLYLTAGNNRLQAIDARIFDNAPNLYNLFVFNNLCVDENFINVVNNRSAVRDQLNNCFETFDREGLIECSFIESDFFPYTCEMSIQNIAGRDDFTEIAGNHVGTNTNSDVERIEAFEQITLNFPSIICHQFDNLREIFFAFSEIEVLPTNTFENCGNLEFLALDMNRITTLNDGLFANNPNLNSISFYSNQLSVIESRVFEGLPLTYLNLDINEMSYINPSWFENSPITYLTMSSNRLLTLPSRGFAGLTNIQTLILSNNADLSFIPIDAFEGLASLNVLHLSNCSISELRHSWFNDLINLQRIYLNSNQISSLPASIFTNLTHVNIQSNNLRTINVNSFVNVENLIQLSAQNNQIFAIDRNFFDSATSLYTLQLLNNDCASQNFVNIPNFRDDVNNALSSCFENFESEVFEISCNYMFEFPYTCFMTLQNPLGRDDFESIDGNHLPNQGNDDVVMVEAENQDSTIIPSVICRQFPNLFYIYMINSNIEVLNENSIGGCRSLAVLTLDSNRISELGENIFNNLPNIALLSFAANRITRVQRNAFAGTNLVMLDLEMNEISEIDVDALQPAANSLFYLILNNNRLTEIPVGTLRGLTTLMFFDLSGNNNLNLSSGLFNDLTMLMSFIIDNCNITSLNANAFNGLSNLLDLSMRQNLITELPENVFNPMMSLQYLIIDSLQLESLNSSSFGVALNSLSVIRARNNRISSIDPLIVQNLDEIYLLNNICVDNNFIDVRNNLEEVMGELSRCF